MDIKSFFFDDIGRLRSGWRFSIFCVGFLFALLVSGGIIGAVINSIGVAVYQGGAVFIINGLAALVPALVVGWLCGKYLEGLPFRALGAWFTGSWLRNLVVGILIGAATVSLAVLIAVVFGGLKFGWNPVDSSTVARSLLISFLIFAAGAAWEEAVFRGYILQTLARSGLAWVGILITSLFFAAIHIDNDNATVISTIDTAIAGVWFGVAYLKTRDLWFVWGMHLMWNWMLGSFFGIEVSGITNLVAAPLLREFDAGPMWLTGADYGIEGGVASTVALVASTILIYYMPFLKPTEEMLELTSVQHHRRLR